MRLGKGTLIQLAAFGGIAGGLIAAVGYWVLSPTTDSLALFILLRVLVGAIAAMLFGSILISGRTRR